MGLFKRRLLEESVTFMVEKKHNIYILNTKITLLQKVTMILNDKLGDLKWSDDEVKSYLLIHKMMLMTDKPLPTLADDEVPPPTEPK